MLVGGSKELEGFGGVMEVPDFLDRGPDVRFKDLFDHISAYEDSL